MPRRPAAVAVLAATVALTVAGGLAGCGTTGQARSTSTSLVLTSLVEELTAAAELKYTATYDVPGTGQVRYSQQAGETVTVAGTRRVLVTDSRVTLCEEQRCRRAPRAAAAPDLVPGFVTPARAVELITELATDPKVTVRSAQRTIDRRDARCYEIRGGQPDFSVCLTDGAVLALFGTGQELRKLTRTADPDDFALPAGATVTEVGRLDR